MSFIIPEEIPEKEVAPGFHCHMIHTERVTVMHVTVEAGAVLPEHQHPHEQITNLIEGQFEMTVGGTTKLCQSGEVILIPSNVPHSAKALTSCRIIDVFQPPRVDYQ